MKALMGGDKEGEMKPLVDKPAEKEKASDSIQKEKGYNVQPLRRA